MKEESLFVKVVAVIVTAIFIWGVELAFIWPHP
jgi:hypothetical protein